MPSPTAPHAGDALTVARFSLVVDGHEIASFSELAAITSEVAPVELLESSDKEVVVKDLPSKRKPPTVVLRRGTNTSMDLWMWHESVVNGDIVAARKNCSLVMYNTDGKPVARYHLEHAWPSKLEIGALKAGTNEALTETVTIVCENLHRVAP
jgi:phage tail-like protein